MGGAENIGDALVPDLANVSKTVRKRRAPKHDFKDGKGKVFAHRHSNGGGWVADTAYVAETVKVTRNAAVFDFARVYDQCQVEGMSKIFGHAQLHHHVRTFGTARVFGYACVQNSSILGHSVAVCDSALVTGNCSFTNNVAVREQARVHNTTISAPRKNRVTRVDGAAKVSDSRLTGYCLIGGSALVDRGMLSFISVQGEGRVSLATLNTYMPNGFWHWLENGEHPWSGAITPEMMLSEIRGTVVATYYSGPRLRMSEHTLMVRCQIPIELYQFNWVAPSTDADWPSFSMEDMEMLVRAENVRSVEDARRRIHNARMPLPVGVPPPQPPMPVAAAAPVIPARGIAPDPSVSRQRRLLRLGE